MVQTAAKAKVGELIKPPATVPVKPRVSNALVELVDFPATVFELTGIDPGYTHFGRSLLPVLRAAIRAQASGHGVAVGQVHAAVRARHHVLGRGRVTR